MESLFKKLKLVDSLVFEYDIEPKEFQKRIKQIVDEETPILLDELYRSKKIFCGKVGDNKFTLRKKRKFMNLNIQSSNAVGILSVENQKTKLNVKIFGYDEISTLAIIIGPIFFLILFSVIIIKKAYPALILFVPIATLILIFPYYIMKKNMKTFRIELKENLKFK
ncbi:hypothetical protein [Psychroserpens burtonensis]|uniref:hypothetical protein n=1 Tax=Psychroserpens burtonensis TaxID=49278 RepID=UPI00041AE2A4|nr:hypothetical protein [Psychroserpens burtonensis]